MEYSDIKDYHQIFLKIDALKEKLNKKRPFTAGEVSRLREQFMVEYTYNSNAIEGNTLTLRETAMIILEGMTINKKPLKDHLEAIGHRDAYLYLEQLVKDKEDISEKIIKDIHSLVLIDKPEDKGRYRRVPVRIMGAIHEPPEPYLIPCAMEELILNYRKIGGSMHILQAIALFHLKFEGIHPFIDGNGRTGRLLLNLELMKEGYPAIDIKFADRKTYYDCFDAFYTKSDAGPMVEIITKYVEERLIEYLEMLS